MSKMSRRTFLWLTGGSSFALATNPPRKLVNKLIPQVIPPENIRPGAWTVYATTCRECPAGCGMHLSHRDGRVTKAEGNPAHPVNEGGLCPRGQSAVQGLYDPDRMQRVVYRERGERDRKQSWEQALAEISTRLSSGGKVAVLSSLQTGALAEVMKGFARSFGSDRVLFYEAFNYEPLKAAHQQLFGQPVIPGYRLDRSDFILSFAADFLETWISPVSFAVQFSKIHSFRGGSRMGRMAYVGPRLSMTAGSADTFIQVPPGYERAVAAALLKVVLDKGWQKRDISAARAEVEALLARVGPIPGVTQQALESLAQSFMFARSAVALAGPVGANGPVATDTALCAALLNYAAGRMGDTVDLSRPHALTYTAREAELDAFFASLGPADVLFVHDTNPIYSRPGTAAHLARAGTVVYLGTMADETARLAHWLLPVDSPLESWGEYEPSAGIRGLMQPTMGRLYDTRPAGDIFIALARMAGKPLATPAGQQPPDFLSWLRQSWGGSGGSITADTQWNAAVRNGGTWPATAPGAGSDAAPAMASFKLTSQAAKQAPAADSAELWLWSSVLAFDGRDANRGWLQETPDPTTFITWGNWVDLHPAKAKALGIADGDLVDLATATGTLRAPVRVSYDVAENAAAIALGHGHSALGKTAKGVGTNSFMLLTPPQGVSTFSACSIRRIGPSPEHLLTRTAPTREQQEREIVQWVRLSELQGMKPGEGDRLTLPLPEGYRIDKDLYPQREYTKHRWAMVIDLQRCIGCGACTVACYAENNISVVGKDKVGGGREMAWLRVAPYRKPDAPLRIGWLPLLCQHCDAAPCEPVCPVFAAMHNEEGLNAQIYNRCIGTRYCSNNCPYKVRRFNWINVKWEKPLDLQLNPEVTVRERGVMEKCTFCVQRIRQAEYQAVRERRKIRDGEIQPACAQTCPTKVYTFGDLLDPEAEVSKLTRSDPRRYHVLEDLNTKPAVTFLRKVDIDVV